MAVIAAKLLRATRGLGFRAIGLALLLFAAPALATDPQFGAIRIEASPNIRHAFVSTQAQSSNANIVSKNEWNAAHTAPTQLVASVPTGMVWPAMPAAVTEFCGASTQYRWRADLTNQTSIRLTAQVVTAGAATSALRLQYTTDTSGASGWDYLDGVSGPSVSISSSGVTTSATVALVAAAKAEVLLRLVGINGDGVGGSACYSAITAGAVAALAANGANCSAGQFPLGVDAAGAAESCTALPTTITGTANQITASAATGGIVLSIPTNPTLPGTTSGTFSGALSGNATTSSALAADGANCPAGSAPLGVDAAGAVQGCFAVPSGTGTVSGVNTGDQTTITGNAGTATALAANGANCSSGEFPLGVDASGAVESCTALPTTITGTANQITASAATGGVVLSIPTNPTLPGTTSGTFSGSLSGNASTATALAANPANCSPGQFPGGVDAAGAAESCTPISTTITHNSTETSGCTAGALFRSTSSLMDCGAGLTYDGSTLAATGAGTFTTTGTFGTATTAGNAITTVRNSITGASATSNFLNTTGTFPSSLSAETNGVRLDFTGNAQAQEQYGLRVNLSGVTSGSTGGVAGYFVNTSAGYVSFGLVGSATAVASNSVGVWGASSGLGSQNAGVRGTVGGSINYGNAAVVADSAVVGVPIFQGWGGPGAKVFEITQPGATTIGGSTLGSTTVPLTARLGAASTANLFEMQNSAGTVLVRIDANGVLKGPVGTGTDGVGGALVDAAGPGTGTAVPADRVNQTSVPGASGTTVQTLGDRVRILGKYTALAEATATSFARVAIASGTVSGGDVVVTVEANDATDYQSRTLHYTWSASNKAGAITAGLSTPTEGNGPSTGTLTCTITLVDAGSGNLDHKADCTSSLAQTVLRANAQVRKNFGVGAISAQ